MNHNEQTLMLALDTAECWPFPDRWVLLCGMLTGFLMAEGYSELAHRVFEVSYTEETDELQG